MFDVSVTHHASAPMTRLLDIIPLGHLHGEGVQWNADDGCVWWTDISGRGLHRLRVDTRHHTAFPTPERLGCFAFIEGDSRLLAAFESGFALFTPDTGETVWLARPEPDGTGRRFNDGRVDRQGRFWAGTMVEDAARAPAASAGLFRLDAHGPVKVLDGIGIANGLCWSPDGQWMYFADSTTRCIRRYRFDAATGKPSAPQVFASTPEGIEPDGSTVDAGGGVWNAQWGGGRVVRYSPAGEVDEVIEVPGASQPSCVAFAGERLDLLCVTTARIGLSAAALASQPNAGHLFLYETSHRGLPECRARPPIEPPAP